MYRKAEICMQNLCAQMADLVDALAAAWAASVTKDARWPMTTTVGNSTTVTCCADDSKPSVTDVKVDITNPALSARTASLVEVEVSVNMVRSCE